MIQHFTPLTAPPSAPTPTSPPAAAAASVAVDSKAAAPSASAAPATSAAAAQPLAFPHGTLCLPLPLKKTVRGQKRWIAHGLPITGKIFVGEFCFAAAQQPIGALSSLKYGSLCCCL
jgi:hypothetical protein